MDECEVGERWLRRRRPLGGGMSNAAPSPGELTRHWAPSLLCLDNKSYFLVLKLCALCVFTVGTFFIGPYDCHA